MMMHNRAQHWFQACQRIADAVEDTTYVQLMQARGDWLYKNIAVSDLLYSVCSLSDRE